MHFRSVKNAIVQPLHHFGYLLAGLPPNVRRDVMDFIGTIASAAYFLPGSHFRRTVENFCRVVGRSDSWPIFTRMIDNIEHVGLHFANLYRYGRSELLAHTVIDPIVETELRRLGSGSRGIIVLVPHCAGAVLSSARLNTVCPTVLLVREPKDPGRCQLMLEYLRKLGPEFILARNTPPAVVTRNILRALHDGKVVVGTTDLVNPSADTIETSIFGQKIHSPGWPARLSTRFGMPILPGYIHMEGSQITLFSEEGYMEKNIQQSTQHWVSSFEKRFGQYPSDWVFMLDKNWARVLATASASLTEPLVLETNHQLHSY